MTIKLSKVDERRTYYKVSLLGSAIDDIELYCNAYQREHGESIEPAKLMASMVINFMASDKDFQRLKKSTLSKLP